MAEKQDPKAGVKSSEFWLVLATVLVTMLHGSGLLGDGGVASKVVALAVAGLAAIGYTFNRSSVKKGPKVEPLELISSEGPEPDWAKPDDDAEILK